MKKSFFDLKHVQKVLAWALMRDGEHVGRVCGHWSDNPNGSVVTCLIQYRDGETFVNETGKAGGYGYCKFSAAFGEAAYKIEGERPEGVHGAGESAVVDYLESRGFTVIRVIG